MDKSKRLCLAVLSAVLCAFSGSLSAASLSDVFQVAESMNTNAKKSQAKIDRLNEETNHSCRLQDRIERDRGSSCL